MAQAYFDIAAAPAAQRGGASLTQALAYARQAQATLAANANPYAPLYATFYETAARVYLALGTLPAGQGAGQAPDALLAAAQRFLAGGFPTNPANTADATAIANAQADAGSPPQTRPRALSLDAVVRGFYERPAGFLRRRPRNKMAPLDDALATLIQTPRRLRGTHEEIEAAFWAAYPRHRFFKGLPFGARLLDIGAGSGGAALWRGWQAPHRPDIRMHGVDRSRGVHAGLYEQWAIADLDAGLPAFKCGKFDGFMASHLIEHLRDPASLIGAVTAVAEAGAHVYLEWPNPTTRDLPTARDLAAHGFTIQTFNFFDDLTHTQTPERSVIEDLLRSAGFRVVESAETRMGMLAGELIARGRERDDLTYRQMGLWASVGWSNVVIAEFLG